MLINDSESNYENNTSTHQFLTSHFDHMNFMLISLPSTSYHNNERDDTGYATEKIDNCTTAAAQYAFFPQSVPLKTVTRTGRTEMIRQRTISGFVSRRSHAKNRIHYSKPFCSSTSSLTTMSSTLNSSQLQCSAHISTINHHRHHHNRHQQISSMKFPNYFLVLCILIFCFTTGSDAFTKRLSSACEMNKDCNKYMCDIENKFHPPMDYFRKPGRSIFTLPCKCQSDWKAHFCRNSARYRLTPIEKEDTLPSICICRQFSDGGGRCQQFMTQCFSSPKPDEPCYCCFNQPGLYCNQLQCSKKQPEFGSKANTTCVCHLPAFYPYHVCKQEDLIGATSTGNSNGESSSLFDRRIRQNSSMIGTYEGQYVEQRSNDVRQSKKFLLLGIEMSSGIAFTIVLSLLGLVALMTTLLLVLRSYRLHKQRHQNDLRRNNAQTILLQQRADDDKYLP